MRNTDLFGLCHFQIEVGMEIEGKCGAIEKITIFEGNPEGVIVIKFKLPSSARTCIDLMNGP